MLLSQPLLFTRAVTIANFVFECVDFCRLQIRLMLYDKFIQISEKIKQHLKSVNVQLRILNRTFYRKNSNKLIIKHQSNPKSTKITHSNTKYTIGTALRITICSIYIASVTGHGAVFLYIYILLLRVCCVHAVLLLYSVVTVFSHYLNYFNRKKLMHFSLPPSLASLQLIVFPI